MLLYESGDSQVPSMITLSEEEARQVIQDLMMQLSGVLDMGSKAFPCVSETAPGETRRMVILVGP